MARNLFALNYNIVFTLLGGAILNSQFFCRRDFSAELLLVGGAQSREKIDTPGTQTVPENLKT